MRLNDVVPVNDLIDRPKFSDSTFDFSGEPLDFPVGLGMFYTGNDVFDIVMNEELSEFVLSMFTISG